MDEGIGERRVEGFGRFIIIDSLTDGIFERVKEEKEEDMLSIIQRERDLTDRLSDNEKKQIQNLLNSIYRKRITDQLYKMVDSTVLYLKNKNKLSNNQWGKFMQFFMDINDLQPEEGIKKFEKYIEKISSKTDLRVENSL